ncbi:MAG: hypothetical protein ACO370_03360 [Ilumatobacteraceae bacterium]
MKDVGFIVASYVITFGSIGVFVSLIVSRARRMSRQIPPEERPWT